MLKCAWILNIVGVICLFLSRMRGKILRWSMGGMMTLVRLLGIQVKVNGRWIWVWQRFSTSVSSLRKRLWYIGKPLCSRIFNLPCSNQRGSRPNLSALRPNSLTSSLKSLTNFISILKTPRRKFLTPSIYRPLGNTSLFRKTSILRLRLAVMKGILQRKREMIWVRVTKHLMRRKRNIQV